MGGAWHIAFYTLFLSIWTILTSTFDVYCLHEAKPGSSHTGFYIFSFDFVYVGNPHIWDLLVMSSVFSLLGGVALCCTNILLLDGLRKELNDLTKLQDMARLKMDTMSSMAPSRAASTVYGQGSRPTSPYVVNMPHGGHQVYQPPTDSMV